MHNEQKISILQSSDFFKHISPRSLALIAAELETIKFAKNTTIFNKGDKPNGLYIIASGTVVIHNDSKSLTTLARAQTFGELALLDSAPRTATATTTNATTTLYLDKYIFDSIITELPKVLRAIIKAIIKYLHST